MDRSGLIHVEACDGSPQADKRVVGVALPHWALLPLPLLQRRLVPALVRSRHAQLFCHLKRCMQCNGSERVHLG